MIYYIYHNAIIILTVSFGLEINESNYNRLTLNMTEGDIIKILKVPPGDYRILPKRLIDDNPFIVQLRLLGYSHHWISDFGKISVCFDRFGKLSGIRYCASPPITIHEIQRAIVRSFFFTVRPINSNMPLPRGKRTGFRPQKANFSMSADFDTCGPSQCLNQVLRRL